MYILLYLSFVKSYIFSDASLIRRRSFSFMLPENCCNTKIVDKVEMVTMTTVVSKVILENIPMFRSFFVVFIFKYLPKYAGIGMICVFLCNILI